MITWEITENDYFDNICLNFQRLQISLSLKNKNTMYHVYCLANLHTSWMNQFCIFQKKKIWNGLKTAKNIEHLLILSSQRSECDDTFITQRYSWNNAKVDIKHQSIYDISIGVIIIADKNRKKSTQKIIFNLKYVMNLTWIKKVGYDSDSLLYEDYMYKNSSLKDKSQIHYSL